MSHPHAVDGGEPPSGGQTKTLFITRPLGLGAPAKITGVLVHGLERKERMEFADAHAALDWCVANFAGLVMAADNGNPALN